MNKLFPEGMSVRWLGHAVFLIEGAGLRLLFDPFLTHNPRFPKEFDEPLRAKGGLDALVITHAHFDHFADVLPLLENDPNLRVICPFEIGEWLQAKGINEERVQSLNPGGTGEFKGVRFTLTTAIHSSSVGLAGEAVALGCPVGYVLRFPNGFTIYNTGDTAVTMDMQIVRDLYRPNLVILPIGDYYTMGAEQAAYALKLLQPEFALGGHWHTWGQMPPGTPEALEREMARYDLPTKLIKLQPGELIS
jgi:L-ascorbate metabolism protein UlaG (beta-lactamase superfamily)